MAVVCTGLATLPLMMHSSTAVTCSGSEMSKRTSVSLLQPFPFPAPGSLRRATYDHHNSQKALTLQTTLRTSSAYLTSEFPELRLGCQPGGDTDRHNSSFCLITSPSTRPQYVTPRWLQRVPVALPAALVAIPTPKRT